MKIKFFVYFIGSLAAGSYGSQNFNFYFLGRKTGLNRNELARTREMLL